MAHSHIVFGMAFGDESKGSITEYLARRHNARLVVRYNGGHQAAHSVVLKDGTHHTFSQFGSATLAGVPTHLSRHVVVSPIAMAREYAALQEKMSTPPLPTVENDCLVTTWYHMAANRVREHARGSKRHGSCGVGIGVTKEYDRSYPNHSVRVSDLRDFRKLTTKLILIRNHYLSECGESLTRYWSDLEKDAAPLFHTNDDLENYAAKLMDAAAHCMTPVNSDYLQRELSLPGEVVFEGAQGFLLDEAYGFFPYCTWSNCTIDNALELIGDHRWTSYGVIRTYAHRHGAGPFVTEDASLSIPEPHNAPGDWQGSFRLGNFDLVALEYAAHEVGPNKIALTHCDWLAKQTTDIRVCVGYQLEGRQIIDGKNLRSAATTDELMSAKPMYRHIRPPALIEAINERCGGSVSITSDGPTFEQKYEI